MIYRSILNGFEEEYRSKDDWVDHVLTLNTIMLRARDCRPMNCDLSPLNLEEARMFGVREMQPNACIPVRYSRGFLQRYQR